MSMANNGSANYSHDEGSAKNQNGRSEKQERMMMVDEKTMPNKVLVPKDCVGWLENW